MTLRQQAEIYLKQASNRNRNPIGISSISGYTSYIRKWIIPELGRLKLQDVKPSTVKPLVEKMSKQGLSPATINLVIGSIKRIVKSAVNSEGEQLYPRTWDNSFMDVPAVVKTEQDAPILAVNELESALGASKGQNRVLYALLASSGLRIGEAEALKAVPECDTDSFWNREKAVIYVRSTFAHNVYQAWTKTEAGFREIDLHPEVNTYLMQADPPKTGWLFRGTHNSESYLRQSTAGRQLKEDGIDKGFHSFRRFRITHLESQNVPSGLQRYWTGHAAKDVHESYIKMGESITIRKEWAIKAGVGFKIPRNK